MIMAPLLIDGYVLLMGLCIGSFLNVCICRIPEGSSIVRPASACPVCNTPIRWYDNLPIVSYILLGGRCRGCKAPISIRYPIVELLTGLFALITWMVYGPSPSWVIFFFFIAALLVITFIDIDHRIIPDIISLPGIAIGFAAAFFLPSISWTDSLIGILIGGGSLWLIAWGYQIIRGLDGMGGGDIKLLAMIGAFLGWKGVLFTIIASSFTGTVMGIIMMLYKGKGMQMALPFGPFLAIGAISYIFMGSQIIAWYFNLN
jgi:leader peptidase (prepilin peptidase)/N-methyltransferase